MSAQPIICSVVTGSHIAYARVLAKSFQEHHPEGRVFVLVVDAADGCGRSGDEPFEAVTLSSLGLPNPAAFCFRYSAFELCNALKPFLVRYLQEQLGQAPILYLDGDTMVFGRLDPIFELLADCSVLLTPHTTTDYPRDGLLPETRGLLQNGTWNAGVIGCGPPCKSAPFLEWWAGHLAFGCAEKTEEGYFVDQKYLDIVPAIFSDVCLLKHDGVNVAHFNLHARRVWMEGARWMVNDVPLLIFHFTLWRALEGRFDSFVSRPVLEAQPSLRQLTSTYTKLLLAAGHEEARKRPYGHATFANGLPISQRTREEFRQSRQGSSPSGDPFSDSRWVNRELDIQGTAAAERRLLPIKRRLASLWQWSVLRFRQFCKSARRLSRAQSSQAARK